MDAEINNVIYMELNSGPKIANSTCGKTIDVETIDRDSTVYNKVTPVQALKQTQKLTVQKIPSIKSSMKKESQDHFRFFLALTTAETQKNSLFKFDFSGLIPLYSTVIATFLGIEIHQSLE